jgi:hypothetical protein
MGDKNRGIYEKYKVERTDGKSAPGQKHENCRYFVIDLDHDKYAYQAIRAYAIACNSEYPKLSKDLEDICNDLTMIELNKEEEKELKVVAMINRSAGNDSVGEMWTETKVFPVSATLEDVYQWANDRVSPHGETKDITTNIKLSIAQ